MNRKGAKVLMAKMLCMASKSRSSVGCSFDIR